jgi:DNA-binding MurR/RpiR family transcriptional regulator
MEYKIHSGEQNSYLQQIITFSPGERMNCLIRIRQRYAGFAQSDKKLADFSAAQPDHARHLSSQQLASEAGVSQSSVVKFAQKIGFKGFRR